MLSKIPKQFFIYGCIAAIVYCLPILWFISADVFSKIWLVYLGNALFLATIFIFVVYYSKHPEGDLKPVNAGFYIAGAGIAFSILGVLLATLIFAPQILRFEDLKQLAHAPASFSQYNSGEIFFILFGSAILGNLIAGSFATIMGASATKRYRKLSG